MDWKCKNCQRIFEIASESSIRFCPNCGAKIDFEETSSNDNGIQDEKSICPVCSTEILPTDEIIICPDCKVAHHKDCWEEIKGCSTYGCPSVGCLNPPPPVIEVPLEPPVGTEGSGGPTLKPLPGPDNAPSSFECPHCHTKLTQGTNVCWSCGKDVTDTVILGNSPMPGPWTRWAARMIDYYIETFILGMILGILRITIDNDVALGIVLGPFAFLLNSAFYAIFGNTLGKWLMGIIVVKNTGLKVNGGEYFKRNMRVYWGGFGLCIPIITLGTFITQYQRINKKQEATYDEKLQMKSIRHNSSAIKSFFGVCLVIFLLLASIAALVAPGANN